MKKHILVVDGNSIAHANHNATPLTVGGMQTQAIFGTLRSMRGMAAKHPNSEQIWLWDGRAQFRFDLYPEYKSNRDSTDPKDIASKAARVKQMPFLKKAITMLGVRQLCSELHEADDLAGFLVPKLSAAGHSVTMVSGDQDWLQAIDENVTWFDPIRDRSCNHKTFYEYTGYETPAAFVEGKALQGDSSDAVTGVGGIGEKGAPLFLAQWKSVHGFFQAVDDGRAGKLGKKHADFGNPELPGRAIFERNMNLMDWKRSRKPTPGEIVTTPGAVDVANFELLCQRLAFASILRDMPMFLRAFNIERETV